MQTLMLVCTNKCSARAGGYYRSNLNHNQLVVRLGCPMGLSKRTIATSPSAPRTLRCRVANAS